MQLTTTMVGAFARPPEAKALVRDELAIGAAVELRAYPENEYDDHAVACYYNDVHIGFIPRTDNGPVFAALQDGDDVFAEVIAFESTIKPILEVTL